MAKNNKKALSLSDLQSLLPVVKEEIVVKVEELQPLPYGEKASKDILMSWLKEANLPLDGWFYVYQDFSRSFSSAPGWYRREVGDWEIDPDNKDLMRQPFWELHFPAYGSSISCLQEKKEFYRKDIPIESEYPWGDGGGGYRDSSRKWN